MNPIAVPELALLTAAVVLGVYLGVQYLRRVRNRPVMIGLHLLLGAASTEIMVMVVHGTPSGRALRAGPFGVASVAIIGLAMLSGLIAGLIARRSRHTADLSLAAHAGVAALGFGTFLVWLFGV